MGVIVDAVVPVDLLPEELGHAGVQPEALLEPDHGRLGPPEAQRVEQRLVDGVLLEGAAALALPVVLDDRRHLAVVADDDDLAGGVEQPGGHQRLGQVHLRSLVEHEAVDRPELLLCLPVRLVQDPDRSRQGAEDEVFVRRQALESDPVVRPGLVLFVFAPHSMNPLGQGAAWLAAQDRNAEQPLVKVASEEPRVADRPPAQIFPRLDDPEHENVGRRVGLAAGGDPEGAASHQRALHPGQDREGGRVALAGAGRPLNQQERLGAAARDEVVLAGLEAVQHAGRVERDEPGHEPLLAIRGFGRPLRRGWNTGHEPVVERVLPPVDDLPDGALQAGPVEVVGVRVQRVGLPVSRRRRVAGERVPVSVAATPHVLHRELEANVGPLTVALRRHRADLDPRRVEELLRRRGVRALLVGGQPRVDVEP